MKPVLPGGTIGIVGGGQLARMMALEARRMGYRVAVLDTDPHGSAGEVVDVFVQGGLGDASALRKLADVSDVITLDTEHVAAELLSDIEASTPVRPGAAVMRIVQDRLMQREFLRELGVPQTAYVELSTAADFDLIAERVGFPCVIKTRKSGYDGKGQARAYSKEELASAWRSIDEQPAVAEAFVDFEKEVSYLLARGIDGEMREYAMSENNHRNHVLHTSIVPAGTAQQVVDCGQIARSIAEQLGHVGVMAVEFFITREGAPLVNEIAPRTHNSGHWTFDAAETSQFEQHLRAVCGLALGGTATLFPSAMLNLLGDLWQNGTPDWRHVFAHPHAHLHLYGKKRAAAGRKMGHVLVYDDQSTSRALQSATELFANLGGK